MTKRFVILSVSFSLFAALFIFSCDATSSSGDSGPCPNDGIGIVNSVGMGRYSYTNFAVNGEASVSWKVDCKDVCTAEHSTVSFQMTVRNVQGIRMEAVILYGILRERPVALSASNLGSTIEYTGSDSFGIKDYYGEGPGDFTALLTMYFPSSNSSWSADSSFVANNVITTYINAHYGKM